MERVRWWLMSSLRRSLRVRTSSSETDPEAELESDCAPEVWLSQAFPQKDDYRVVDSLFLDTSQYALWNNM